MSDSGRIVARPVGSEQTSAGSDVTLDAVEFRAVLGHLPTGVTVITTSTEAGPAGMAVGSFSSVSLDPPLVGFFAAKTSTTWPSIRDAGIFCANVLCEDQESICRAFARSGGDKFAGMLWKPTRAGMPIINGVLAWIECTVEHLYEAGDHELCIGRVSALGREMLPAYSRGPLVFYRGAYGALGEQANS